MEKKIEEIVDAFHKRINRLEKLQMIGLKTGMQFVLDFGLSISCDTYSIYPHLYEDNKFYVKFKNEKEIEFSTANQAVSFLFKENSNRLKKLIQEGLDS